MSRFVSVSALLCIASAFSQNSYANVFDTYGQSASTVALGNANSSSRSSYAAASNPASLTLSKTNELATSLIMTSFQLRDLPDAPGTQLPPDSLDESRLAPSQGASLGLNLKLTEDLHFGMAAYMPQGNFGRIRGLSPYQSSYLRFSEQQQKPAIFTAVAIELPADLSLGLGAYYSLRAKGVLQVSLSRNESEGRFDFVMEPVVVPYAGVLWAPKASPIKLGLSFRPAQETQSEITSAFAFSTEDALLPFDATTSLVPFYDPELIKLGFAYETSAWSLYLAFEQARWSKYRPPLVTLTGKDVAALSSELPLNDAGLRDTQAFQLGLALPLHEAEAAGLELRSGLEYHSSANRSQVRSLAIDPARWTLAAGGAWNFAKDSTGRRLTLEAAYQYNQLEIVRAVSAKGAPIRVDGGSSLQTFVGGLNYAL